MPNEAANQEQTFLMDLLKAIYQNQEIYPLLQHNLSKLNDNLALMLRKWVSVDASACRQTSLCSRTCQGY
ncbi:hypothetical protein [Nostoc sp.]|uniref:hypothetical protein n=1 Tax=Nostoc sp. TaxID=1180 RepID=UPI002FFA13FC